MKLTIHEFVSLDGVMQGPGGADEDPSNGFDRGGWLVPYFDDDVGRQVSEWFERADEFLLGRTTYELMFPYWSKVREPDNVVARQLNALPKHVATRTLTSTEWDNSTPLRGDVVEAVNALKAKPGRELQVHGSAGLAQTLIAHELIDQYRLMVFPVVVGAGKRLFEHVCPPASLRLVASSITKSGIALLTYQPTGDYETGRVPGLDEAADQGS